LDASKAPATKRAYRSDYNTFTTWAEAKGLDSLPASGSTVANYITYMADEGRAPSTISRALTSISQAHKTLDMVSPTQSPEVANVYKGIRRTKGTAQRRAKPLVIAELKRLCDSMRPSFLGRRDKALILIGWAGALRRSELVALDLDDVDFVDEGMTISIASSKTDQEGAGYKLGIPFASDKQYCPVLKLKHWLDLAVIVRGPLFIALGTPGKKFHAEISEPRRLAASAVNTIIKRRLKQAGMNAAGYSGHSLRAGFITTAAAQSTPEYLIQAHTRHRSAKVLRGYMRDGSLFSSNPLSILL
jgi:integrase